MLHGKPASRACLPRGPGSIFALAAIDDGSMGRTAGASRRCYMQINLIKTYRQHRFFCGSGVSGLVALVGPKPRLLSGCPTGEAAALGLAVKLRAGVEIDFRCRIEPYDVALLAELRCAVLGLKCNRPAITATRSRKRAKLGIRRPRCAASRGPIVGQPRRPISGTSIAPVQPPVMREGGGSVLAGGGSKPPGDPFCVCHGLIAIVGVASSACA